MVVVVIGLLPVCVECQFDAANAPQRTDCEAVCWQLGSCGLLPSPFGAGTSPTENCIERCIKTSSEPVMQEQAEAPLGEVVARESVFHRLSACVEDALATVGGVAGHGGQGEEARRAGVGSEAGAGGGGGEGGASGEAGASGGPAAGGGGNHPHDTWCSEPCATLAPCLRQRFANPAAGGMVHAGVQAVATAQVAHVVCGWSPNGSGGSTGSPLSTPPPVDPCQHFEGATFRFVGPLVAGSTESPHFSCQEIFSPHPPLGPTPAGPYDPIVEVRRGDDCQLVHGGTQAGQAGTEYTFQVQIPLDLLSGDSSALERCGTAPGLPCVEACPRAP